MLESALFGHACTNACLISSAQTARALVGRVPWGSVTEVIFGGPVLPLRRQCAGSFHSVPIRAGGGKREARNFISTAMHALKALQGRFRASSEQRVIFPASACPAMLTKRCAARDARSIAPEAARARARLT